MPFPSASFDVVWTEHAQMNVVNKVRLYSEMARVLKPGGRLAFHDICAGPTGSLRFPVPWASDSSISSLISQAPLMELLRSLGFGVAHWEDVTRQARAWYEGVLDHITKHGYPVLGLHLLMGSSSLVKLENALRNTVEGRISFVQAVLRKSR